MLKGLGLDLGTCGYDVDLEGPGLGFDLGTCGYDLDLEGLGLKMLVLTISLFIDEQVVAYDLPSLVKILHY